MQRKINVAGSVYKLLDEYFIKQALGHLPVSGIWGEGRQLAKHLKNMGTHTALQLRDADTKTLKRRFSVLMEQIILELRSIPNIEFDNDPKKKQIICTRSFGKKTGHYQLLAEAISYHATRACVTLKEQGSDAICITIGIKTNPISRKDKQYTCSITINLPEPCDITQHFLKAATQGLKKIFKKGYQYKKADIMLADISDTDMTQIGLFNQITNNKKVINR